MSQILAIVLPVFGLIGIGALVAWTGLLGRSSGDALSEFVFVVAIPVLVFRIMATADLGSVSAWRLWLAFFAAFVVSWIAGTMLTRRLFGRDARGGLVAGLAAGYGNTTLIGIPLALAAFGAEGSVPMALIIAVQLPLMMTAIALLMVRAERQDGVEPGGPRQGAALRSVAENLIGNPIILGLAAGLAWRVSGVPLAGLPADLVNRLADVAGTLALFAMGMSLKNYGIKGNVAASFALTAVKLIAMPALAVAFARLVGLPPVATKVAIIAAACPTGVTPFLVAGRFRTGEGLASTTITLSTALAVLSVAFWLKVVDWL
jgi:malonate transporter and related proteins